MVLFAEGSPTGSHLKLTKLNATLVPEISYEQPIFVPLEDSENISVSVRHAQQCRDEFVLGGPLTFGSMHLTTFGEGD